MDKLEYGWWERKRGNVKIPPYLGDKRNFTLTLEELEKYDAMLSAMVTVCTDERRKVRLNYVAMKNGQLPAFSTDTPRCTSLAHVMEFMVQCARSKLALTQFLVDVTGQRVKEKRDDVS